MDIALLAFNGMSALDGVGPYEVLVRLPGSRLSIVGSETGVVRMETGALGLGVDRTLSELPRPDIVIVPGGPGVFAAAADVELMAWLRQAFSSARSTLTVCSGSVLLAATGLLEGRRVATSWHVRDQLARFGAQFAPDRVVETDRLYTAAGATAGIDAALLLAAAVAGEQVARAIQLGLEYAPEPPFDSGDPSVASPELRALCAQVGIAATTAEWATPMSAGS